MFSSRFFGTAWSFCGTMLLLAGQPWYYNRFLVGEDLRLSVVISVNRSNECLKALSSFCSLCVASRGQRISFKQSFLFISALFLHNVDHRRCESSGRAVWACVRRQANATRHRQWPFWSSLTWTQATLAAIYISAMLYKVSHGRVTVIVLSYFLRN